MQRKNEIDLKYQKIIIPDPELNYVFTVSLNGKLDSLPEELEANNTMRFDQEKDIDLTDDKQDIFALQMTDSFVNYYVDKSFVRAVTPIRFVISKPCQRKIEQNAISRFSDFVECNKCSNISDCSEYEFFSIKLQNNAKMEKRDCLNFLNICEKEYKHLISGIEIKFFSQGSLSILIRFICGSSISVYDLISDIKYPENITMPEKECFSGPLNKYATLIAHEVLKYLLQNNKCDLFKDLLEKSFTSFINELSFQDSIQKKVDSFLKDADPYVGIVCSNIDINGKDNPDVDSLNRIYIALTNKAPEFLDYFIGPNEYDSNNNIARGEEILLVEKRGWLMVSPRLKEAVRRDRFRRGFVNSLIYSIESIFAATKTIEKYNNNLEQHAKRISHIFNMNVYNYHSRNIKNKSKPFSIGSLSKVLQEFISVIAKARAISPCEDISTSMEAHAKSPTLVKAIGRLKAFGMNDLITLARARMRNYGYFLETGHKILMEESRKSQGKLMMWTSILMLIITILMFISTIITGKEIFYPILGLQG